MPGCAVCHSPGICSKCRDNFLLSADGTHCEYLGHYYFKFVYAVLAVIGVFVAWYLIGLYTRSQVNREVLEHAIRHRGLCRIARHNHTPSGEAILEPWRLSTNLFKNDVAGQGVVLYFRWLVFLLGVSIVLAICSYVAYQYSPYAKQAATNAAGATVCPGMDSNGVEVIDHEKDPMLLAIRDRLHRRTSWIHTWLPTNYDDLHQQSRAPGGRHLGSQLRRLSSHLSVSMLVSPPSKSWLPTVYQPDVVNFQVHNPTADDDQGVEGVLQKNAKSNEENVAQKYIDHHRQMVYTYMAVYVFMLLASFFMMHRQFQFSENWDDEHTSHSDFTIWLAGLPPTMIRPDPLHEYLAQLLNQEGAKSPSRLRLGGVVGVSIAYDTSELSDPIEEAVNLWMDELQDKHIEELNVVDEHAGASPNRGGRLIRSQSSLTSPRQLAQDLEEERLRVEEEEKQEGRCGQCMRGCSRLEFVDSIIMGSPLPEKPPPRQKSVDVSWLSDVTCSGDALVVLDTEEGADTLNRIFKESNEKPPPPFYFEGHNYVLTSKKMGDVEPPEVLWDGFHREAEWKIVLRMTACVFLIALAICIFLILYIPYAMYWKGLIEVPGAHGSGIQDFLLGLLIGIGNAIVGMIVDLTASTASFRTKDKRDATVVTVSFIATFINVMVDLMMTAAIVKGVRLDHAFEEDVKGYDLLLATHLYELIVPGYLFLPLVLQPIMTNLLPYFLSKGIVGSRWVPKRLAEQSLEQPEFDICWRYSDCLNNFTITLTLGALSSPYSWQVCACLVGYVVLVLIIDRLLLLRLSCMTMYTTNSLSVCFIILWVVPTGAVAALIGWWAWKAGLVSSPIAVFLLVSFHILLYSAILRYMWKSHAHNKKMAHRMSDISYDNCYASQLRDGKPFTYFNTNLVFCLRTKYLPSQESGWHQIKSRHAHDPASPGCVPWVKGKMHLQPGVTKTISEDLSTGLITELSKVTRSGAVAIAEKARDVRTYTAEGVTHVGESVTQAAERIHDQAATVIPRFRARSPGSGSPTSQSPGAGSSPLNVPRDTSDEGPVTLQGVQSTPSVPASRSRLAGQREEDSGGGSGGDTPPRAG